jgi:hypothetical protein
VSTWPEPQLSKDTIEAGSRDEGERLRADRKRTKQPVEQQVRLGGRRNPGEHLIEGLRRKHIVIRHGPPPSALAWRIAIGSKIAAHRRGSGAGPVSGSNGQLCSEGVLVGFSEGKVELHRSPGTVLQDGYAGAARGDDGTVDVQGRPVGEPGN